MSVPSSVELLADRLLRAERPVCLAGRGALWSRATDELVQLCAALPRFRVASTPGAKGVFPEGHPQALGVWGFSGHQTAFNAVCDSDELVIVGSRLREQSTSNWDPRLGAEHVTRVDRDPLACVVPEGTSQLTICSDAKACLRQLLALVQGVGSQDVPLRRRATPPITRFASTLGDGFVKPQALFSELSDTARNVPVACDAGNAMCWGIEWLERNAPGTFLVSMDWGTMGYAIPAALAACVAGDGPSIAVTGDGSIAMAGGELHTAVELELPLVVIVLNDAGAGMVGAGCDAWFGPNQIPDPSYRYRMNLAGFGRALGAHGEVVTCAQRFVEQLRQALERPTPTLLDVQVDPSDVPAAISARVRSLKVKPSQHGQSQAPDGGGIC